MKNNNPANFKLRFLAQLLDNLIGLVVFVLCIFYILQQPNLAQAISLFLLLTIIILLNPFVIYNSIFFTHFFGGSPGKLLTGLQVTDENGNRLKFKRILFRQTIGYSFSWLVFGLGYLAVIKDPQKQAWHDKAVGSKVLIHQNHWPLAMIFSLFLIFASSYLIIEGFNDARSGPLYTEAQKLWEDSKKESEKKKIELRKVNIPPTPAIQ